MRGKLSLVNPFSFSLCPFFVVFSCGPRMTFQGLDFKIGASDPPTKLEESFDFNFVDISGKYDRTYSHPCNGPRGRLLSTQNESIGLL